jgi:DNA-binding transcriptional LysR family regulator
MKNRPVNSLDDLHVFLAVAAARNFSTAARDLSLPPSSISRRIGALERRLGVTLFKRTTREMMLTEAGIAYGKSIERIFGELQEADLAVSRFATIPEGRLRIESRPGLSAWLLAPLLPRFLAQYPTIQIDLKLTNQAIDTLAPGTDIGIRYGLASPSSLVTRKIVTTRQGVYASPAYLARRGTPATPDDLLNHDCLVFALDDEPVRWRFRRGDYDRSLGCRGSLTSNDVSTLGTATINDLGVAVAHEWVMERAVREGQVVPILTDYEVSTMNNFDLQVCAIYSPAMKNVQKVRVFIDFLLSALRRRPEGEGYDRGEPRSRLELVAAS